VSQTAFREARIQGYPLVGVHWSGSASAQRDDSEVLGQQEREGWSNKPEWSRLVRARHVEAGGCEESPVRATHLMETPKCMYGNAPLRTGRRCQKRIHSVGGGFSQRNER